MQTQKRSALMMLPTTVKKWKKYRRAMGLQKRRVSDNEALNLLISFWESNQKSIGQVAAENAARSGKWA